MIQGLETAATKSLVGVLEGRLDVSCLYANDAPQSAITLATAAVRQAVKAEGILMKMPVIRP